MNSIQEKTAQPSVLSRVWKQFTSMKFAIIVLVILAVVSVAALFLGEFYPVRASAPGWEEYWQHELGISDPVFKILTFFELHDPYPKEQYIDESIFPVIRAGNVHELQMICNDLGVSNHLQTQETWVRTRRVSNSVHWMSNQIKSGLVPNVTGMTLRDAIFLLENEGLVVNYKGHGRVIKQSQNPGKKALKGSRILLELG